MNKCSEIYTVFRKSRPNLFAACNCENYSHISVKYAMPVKADQCALKLFMSPDVCAHIVHKFIKF